MIRPANRPTPDGLVLDDESAGLVATWACPNHNFCGPSPPSDDWTVAPLRLTAEIKSGTGSWTDASATVDGVQTTHAVSGLARGTVHELRTRAVTADDQEGSASGVGGAGSLAEDGRGRPRGAGLGQPRVPGVGVAVSLPVGYGLVGGLAAGIERPGRRRRR